MHFRNVFAFLQNLVRMVKPYVVSFADAALGKEGRQVALFMVVFIMLATYYAPLAHLADFLWNDNGFQGYMDVAYGPLSSPEVSDEAATTKAAVEVLLKSFDADYLKSGVDRILPFITALLGGFVITMRHESKLTALLSMLLVAFLLAMLIGLYLANRKFLLSLELVSSTTLGAALFKNASTNIPAWFNTAFDDTSTLIALLLGVNAAKAASDGKHSRPEDAS